MTIVTSSFIRTSTCQECGFKRSGSKKSIEMVMKLHLKQQHNINKSNCFILSNTIKAKSDQKINHYSEIKRLFNNTLKEIRLPENHLPEHGIHL
jgi:NADH:ubiquinone oxidoreductase subunit F (NADH-binding)